MKRSGKSKNKSHSSDLHLAGILFLSSVSSVYLLWGLDHRYATFGILISLLFIPVSIWVGKQYFQRGYGLKVEKKALSGIDFPDGWIVKPNLPTKMGDCDLFLISPSGVKFVVEIKAYNGLKTNLFGKVVKLNGSKCLRDPVTQAIGLKGILKADKAIVWCPRAKTSSRYESRGVVLVNGDERKLKLEVGIRSFF